MDVKAALKNQYHAALAMLRQAIEECPEKLWVGGDYPVAFWRVAYHVLFFTHFYLQSNHNLFFGRGNTTITTTNAWARFPIRRTASPRSGIRKPGRRSSSTGGSVTTWFPWYKLPKLDHQVNNIRHVQHHAALLAGRLRVAEGSDIRWVGFG